MPILTTLARLVRHWRQKRITNRFSSRLRTLSPILAATLVGSPSADWVIERIVHCDASLLIATIGPRGSAPLAVLKSARNQRSIARLERQYAVANSLHNDPRLAGWRRIVPRCLLAHLPADPNTDEYTQRPRTAHYFLVEELLLGVDGRTLQTSEVGLARFRSAATASIGELHRRTAVGITVDAEMIRQWIDEPLDQIERASGRKRHSIESLRAELHSSLFGRSLTFGWVHGDFQPANILVEDAAKDLPVAASPGAMPIWLAISGIVDWERARPYDFAFFDLIQLVLAARSTHRNPLSANAVDAVLAQNNWQPAERLLFDQARAALPGEQPQLRILLLLFWLRYVSAGFARSRALAGRWLWVAQQIEQGELAPYPT